MIAVIADDFTGAAEIGGIGLRRDLKIVIETDVNHTENSDLLIIVADTRSESPEFSIKETDRITRQLMKYHPAFIYKKLDSVLRGNVADELTAQMEASGKHKAIIVAGNPHFGRIIRNGVYYINGIPVVDTFFANDPEFPVQSSKVTEIVGAQRADVFSLSVQQQIPDKGLIIGNVVNESDMIKWADKVDEDSVPAGGAGFFNIILDRHFPQNTQKSDQRYILGQKILFVFGSAYPKNPDEIRLLQQKGFVFINMPEGLYLGMNGEAGLTEEWSEKICRELSENGKVIISVSHIAENNLPISGRIRENMGIVVRKVIDKVEINDLLIEGGATTSVILKYLEISRLFPFRELESGVIQMKTEKYPDLCITTKPGSYHWPECLIFNDERCFEKKKSK